VEGGAFVYSPMVSGNVADPSYRTPIRLWCLLACNYDAARVLGALVPDMGRTAHNGHAGGDTVAAASVGPLPAYSRPCACGRPQIATFDRIGRVPAFAGPERLR